MVRLTETIVRIFNDMQAWGRNAKVTVLSETFWSMPIAWIFFYQTIFMRELGIDEMLIGISLTLNLILQVFLPMLGGYLADRVGRKRTIMFFDTFGWIGTTGMLFIAKEFWQIVLAMVFQALPYAIEGVWDAYLGEDTMPRYRAGVFGFIRLIWIVAGLLTPIAGALISSFGVEQGFRYVALLATISTAVMLLIRQILLRESEVGKMLSSSDDKILTRPKSYIETLRIVTKHKEILILLLLSIIQSTSGKMIITFRPLFLTDPRALALDESVVSVIPTASSISGILILSLVIPRLKPSHIRKALIVSYVSGFLGLAVLVIALKESIFLAIISAILDSLRFLAAFSIMPVLLFNTVDKVDPFAQAKIMSMTMTFSALVSWPIPAVGGYLYAVNPMYPFLFAALSLIISVGLLLK